MFLSVWQSAISLVLLQKIHHVLDFDTQTSYYTWVSQEC